MKTCVLRIFGNNLLCECERKIIVPEVKAWVGVPTISMCHLFTCRYELTYVAVNIDRLYFTDVLSLSHHHSAAFIFQFNDKIMYIFLHTSSILQQQEHSWIMKPLWQTMLLLCMHLFLKSLYDVFTDMKP